MRQPTPATVLATFVSFCAAALCACTDESDPDESREFVVTIDNLTPANSLFRSGTFDTPVTGLDPGPLEPGHSYSFEVVVEPGSQLQIFTMFVESNDAFLAFAPGGIAMWSPTGEPLDGDRSHELVLYDAGTEANEPLGIGEFQAPRQTAPGLGDDHEQPITVIAEGDGGPAIGPEGVEFPAIAEFVEVHVLHRGGPDFRVILTNVSSDDLIAGVDGTDKISKPAVLSPGVFVVHEAGVEWFEVGEPASPQLEWLAEDGDPSLLAALFEYLHGVASDLSGVVWAVHDGDIAVYGTGSPATAGLEALVEDGRPEGLLAELASIPEIDAHGLALADDPVVIEPGGSVEFRFRGAPGDHLSFVTGYLAANDKFVGLGPTGLELFGPDGEPRCGDIGWAVELLDAGTEIDEPPGLGAHQFERQSLHDGGIDEGELIREVRGEWKGWAYPPANEIIRVGIDLADGHRVEAP